MDELKLFESTSGRVHYQVHKWTSLLQNLQSGRIEIVSTSGRVCYQVHKWTSLSQSPQSGRIEIVEVHKWTSSLLSPQVDEFIIKHKWTN